ncbi:V-type proton ATPase subunit S1-like [Tribolium madens]|uniref:V-type proton ATPase subunit S1-like n=1 Tax=Tribolium madens TaxID=41895 RepID=UPI001CF75AAE|nr:V-type proton ATPase subunit S1-like [Tribolium madens]
MKVILLVAILTFSTCQSAVLLWSTNKLEISPFNDFNDENLQDLVQKLGFPDVTVYRSSHELLPKFETLVKEYRRAYNPNGDITTENATEISTDEDFALIEAKQRLDLMAGNNTLSVLYLPSERYKRSVPTTTENPDTSKEPVLYKGTLKKNIFTLLYSSHPLVLHQDDGAEEPVSFTLGESRMVTVDSPGKDSYTKLYVKVPVQDNNFVILQFFFYWFKTYWSLTSVKVSTTNGNFSTTLNITEPFLVPAGFSYHCNGLTTFKDNSKTELRIYDLQVQIDSKNGLFSDAYDCIDFTTVPIWSGLFVTGLLGIGLIIALTAINDIKTMDKFDNYKTKQLSITVNE